MDDDMKIGIYFDNGRRERITSDDWDEYEFSSTDSCAGLFIRKKDGRAVWYNLKGIMKVVIGD